jgi:hypothetical protein
MAIRGLKASPEGIKKAHQALIRNSLNKKALAGELGIARSTVQLFFNPQPVERFNFKMLNLSNLRKGWTTFVTRLWSRGCDRTLLSVLRISINWE